MAPLLLFLPSNRDHGREGGLWLAIRQILQKVSAQPVDLDGITTTEFAIVLQAATR